MVEVANSNRTTRFTSPFEFSLMDFAGELIRPPPPGGFL
jgi:hypothetical protein